MSKEKTINMSYYYKFLKSKLNLDLSLYEMTLRKRDIIIITSFLNYITYENKEKELEPFNHQFNFKFLSLSFLLSLNLDAFCFNQIMSKSWLVEELNNLNISKNSNILIVGGWYGILSLFLFKNNYFNIQSIDLISEHTETSKVLNKLNRNFKSSTADMFEIDSKKYDIIINTCGEHIDLRKWFDLIPKEKIIILQSTNNNDYEDHINIVNSLEEFKEQVKFNKIYYEGEKIVGEQKYTRYMLIGEK